MTLTIEWRHRLDNWLRELPVHFYRALGAVAWQGVVGTELLTPEEALAADLRPMPPGTSWGAKWEYGYFVGQVTLPEAAAAERIALRVDTGGESAIYVNGVAAGASDRFHHEITLAMQGVPGETYDILVESYAGHGLRTAYAGPTPPGRETVPEPPATQVVVGESTYGIWQEVAYQLWLDVTTLLETRDGIDPDSLRVSEIDAGLRDFTVMVDFELEREAMLDTMRECRQRLAPLLACTNGSTAPTLFAIGHSHIDVAWLWPLAETERKCVRTFGTALALMDEYPEYQFIQSEPHLYRWIKEGHPALYARMKEAVARGQLVPEGGMWVEADTNISSGESLIRQFTHGKRFFQDEFGVDCRILWLPDVFGYSGNMPQIMKGCGIDYFATAKIFWAYNGGEPFPHNTFEWEGIDGSRVLVHLMNDYNSRTNPASVIERWNQRVQKDGLSTRLFPFGYGDGGGGPTRNHLEYIRRLGDLEGVPRVRIAHPIEYFHDQEARGVPDIRYVGELYFQAHRGTYTSQARTKRGNRVSELALREAEMWGAIAKTHSFGGYEYPYEALDEAWKKVLLNQFHDIIPGSSIHRVYEEAEALYDEVIETANEATSAALDGIANAESMATHAALDALSAPDKAKDLADKLAIGDDLLVFNSLSWSRDVLVNLSENWGPVCDFMGFPLPMQIDRDGDYIVEVNVPSCGWTTVQQGEGDHIEHLENTLVATTETLENEYLRLTLNDRGEITSIWDKQADRELAAAPCAALKMYKDVPTYWDAWDLDSMYEQTPVALGPADAIDVLEAGPLVAIVRVTRILNTSPMVQEIVLRRGSRRVEFVTRIDWKESHKLLKVDFPVTIHAHEALHEIQFGHIARPTHKSRPFDADRFEVSAHKWSALVEGNRGFAVLNDCKYGLNVDGNRIALTLLKSAMAPDMTADKRVQEFTYGFYAWNGPFIESGLVREGYELNCPPSIGRGDPYVGSVFEVDAANVLIETVKLAEDGSGDVIVRLYEAMRTATRCTLSTSLDVSSAVRTDMLERPLGALEVVDGAIGLEFGPFEVVTVRLKSSEETSS